MVSAAALAKPRRDARLVSGFLELDPGAPYAVYLADPVCGTLGSEPQRFGAPRRRPSQRRPGEPRPPSSSRIGCGA